MTPSDATRGILMMLASLACFTLMDAQAKYLTQDYAAIQVIWARYSGQTALVLLVLLPRLTTVLRTRHPRLHMLRSMLQFGATAFFFASLGHIGLAEATAIADINPVLITLGAGLFLGERLGPRRLAGVGAALVGAMIIIRPGAGLFDPAALLPLACAFCFAGYALATRYAGASESAATSLAYSAMLGTLITSIAMIWKFEPVLPQDIWRFVSLSLLGTAGQLLLIRAFISTEASVIAPFGYTGILFATTWGVLFFGEWPDKFTIAGALVITGAGLYVWHRETRARLRAAS